jgi:hypothetical protein
MEPGMMEVILQKLVQVSSIDVFKQFGFECQSLVYLEIVLGAMYIPEDKVLLVFQTKL